MKIRVYLNARTVEILLARKNMDKGWLADQAGISRTALSMMMGRYMSPSPMVRARIVDVFRGMSIKKGGRLVWDDLFKTEIVDSEGSVV